MEDIDPYAVGKDAQWRDTLEDGVLMFANARPAIFEQALDPKTSKASTDSSKYDLWEANCIRTLKGELSTNVVASKLYYYQKHKAVYNVLEVKKNSSDQPTFVRMLKHKATDEVLLDEQCEIDTLRDFINLNIKIHSEASNDIINTQVKLQNKLENELADPILGATGKSLSMFKLFRDSRVVDKESFISFFDDIKDDDFIFATTGLSKSSTFKRFNPVNYSRYWSSNGRNLDAITFIPNQNVIFGGFSLFASYDVPKFEAKYEGITNWTFIWNYYKIN